MPSQLWAFSIIRFFESTEVLCAIHNPAHRVAGSLECNKDKIRVVHFDMWGDAIRDPVVSDEIVKGRKVTADESVAS